MNKSTNYIITNKRVLLPEFLLREHVLNCQHSSLSASKFSNAGQLSKFLKLLGSPLVSISATMFSEVQYVSLILHKITNEVVFYVDMLGPSVDLMILSQTYGRLVVIKNSCFSDALLQQVTCELLKLHSFLGSSRQSNILHFGS